MRDIFIDVNKEFAKIAIVMPAFPPPWWSKCGWCCLCHRKRAENYKKSKENDKK